MERAVPCARDDPNEHSPPPLNPLICANEQSPVYNGPGPCWRRRSLGCTCLHVNLSHELSSPMMMTIQRIFHPPTSQYLQAWINLPMFCSRFPIHDGSLVDGYALQT